MIAKRKLLPAVIVLTICLLGGCKFNGCRIKLPLDHISKIEGDIVCEFRAGRDATNNKETVKTDAVFDKDKFVELYNECKQYDPAWYQYNLDRLDLRIVRETQPLEFDKMAASEVNFMANTSDGMHTNVSIYRYDSKMYFFILSMGGASKPDEIGYYYKEVPEEMLTYWTPLYEKVLADKAADYKERYGDFSPERINSFDNEFYAQTMPLATDMIEIQIFSTGGDIVAEFQPCRSSDYWGICWEKDSHNIWVQSGDVGYVCYTQEGKEWVKAEGAVKPDYIHGKYENKE